MRNHVIATAAAIAAVSNIGLAKTKLHLLPENTSYETVQFLPNYKEEVKEGVTTYTVKVQKAKENNPNGYIEFDKPVTVKKTLYTYSTQKFQNEKLLSYEDENSILFNDTVRFKAGSVLKLRTNVDEKLSDFVNFNTVILDTGELLVEVTDESITPRFVKLPLFVAPKAIMNAKVSLAKPLEISGVVYALKSEIVENDYALYYIEPIYPTESIAQKFAMYENNLPKETYPAKQLPSSALLREKISLFREGKLIYTSNAIDLFTK